MSLQLILGNSGSGKSTWLYDYVIEQAGAHPDKNYIFLVPEQFTLQTQKEFVNRHPNHSILNIDVLSFRRLAYRVFDELGMMDFAVLEETGKNLALRKAAADKEEGLLALKGNIHKTGYISEVKSLISEMVQYHVSVEDLKQAQGALEAKNALWYKLNDIITLYEGYRQLLEGRYVTADELETLLAQTASESGMLRGATLVLDGYTGFTPVQNELLEELFPLVESVFAAVTVDERESFFTPPLPQELFCISKKSIQFLCDVARRKGVEIKDPVFLENGEKKRYRNAPALFHLEQNLFRPNALKYKEKKGCGSVEDTIRVCSFFQPKNELHYIAQEIHRLVSKEEGFRYKDIAVVTGDMPAYADYAEEIFALYDIPLFVDQKKNILFHPFIELVRAILEMETADYSYETVMRYFRSGFSGLLDADTLDLLDNYLLAFGIRGFSGWKKSWVRPADWLTEEQLERLNEGRQAFVSVFSPLHQAFHKKKATVLDMTKELYELLELLHVQEQIEAQKEYFESEGMLAQAKENEQIYGIVIHLFDKLAELLGEECISRTEYAQILDAGFEASQVGIIPPGYDRVLFGDIERTRIDHIKVLFFIGVNDGVIPKNDGKMGILSEYEREKLAALDLELAPGAREKAFIQKFYLYLNIAKPSRKLYLTFSKAGSDGAARRESYFIHAVLKLFPQLTVQTPPERGISTAKSSMRYFLSGLEKAKEGGAPEDWKALYAWYMREETWADKAKSYVEAAFYRHKDSKLNGELTKRLYGTILENSVTRLERFAGCAFAHFLQYGLKLSKRQLYEFAPVDFGNIIHDALWQYARRMEAGGDDWFQVTKENQRRYAGEALEAAIAACQNTALSEGARSLYLVNRMEKVLERTVETLGYQIKSGSFLPQNYEVSFQYVQDLSSVNFTLGEEERMRLRGRIDRLDTWEREKEVYVKVIDYKSGSTSFQLLNVYHGLQLQLVVYLNAAMELMEKKYPDKEIKPAGIFYYHIDDPLLEEQEELTEEEIRERIFEKLKLDGYVNSSPEVYHAMDHGMGASSNIIPVVENKDGSLRKSSKAVSEGELMGLCAFVSQKIMELGGQIMDGEIAVNPYELNGKTPCGYCPYRSVCGFDLRIDGFGYRKLDQKEK